MTLGEARSFKAHALGFFAHKTAPYMHLYVYICIHIYIYIYISTYIYLCIWLFPKFCRRPLIFGSSHMLMYYIHVCIDVSNLKISISHIHKSYVQPTFVDACLKGLFVRSVHTVARPGFPGDHCCAIVHVALCERPSRLKRWPQPSVLCSLSLSLSFSFSLQIDTMILAAGLSGTSNLAALLRASQGATRSPRALPLLLSRAFFGGHRSLLLPRWGCCFS